MPRWLKRYLEERFLIKLISRIGGTVSLMFMMLLIVCDVVTRYIQRPIIGAVEMTQVTMVVLVCLALANTQHEDHNVSVSLFMGRFPERIQTPVNVFVLSLALLFFCIMTWRTGVEAVNTYRLRMVWWNLPVPLWIPYSFVPIGFFLLCVELMLEIVDHIRILVGKAGLNAKRD